MILDFTRYRVHDILVCADTLSPVSPAADPAGAARLELLEPTHRGLHRSGWCGVWCRVHTVLSRFVPRHRDEIVIDIGDPVYVSVEAEDGWCEGQSEIQLSDLLILDWTTARS